MGEYSASELYHHGILGQKWGVRRYQNRDGTLTSKGKKRYLDSDGEFTAKGKMKYDRDRAKIAYKYGVKPTPEGKVPPAPGQQQNTGMRKAEDESFDEYKARVLTTGSANDILSIKDSLTNKELGDAYQRLNYNRLISDIAKSQEPVVKDGWQKAEDVLKKVKVVNDYLTTGINIATNVNKIKDLMNGKKASEQSNDAKPVQSNNKKEQSKAKSDSENKQEETRSTSTSNSSSKTSGAVGIKGKIQNTKVDSDFITNVRPWDISSIRNKRASDYPSSVSLGRKTLDKLFPNEDRSWLESKYSDRYERGDD